MEGEKNTVRFFWQEEAEVQIEREWEMGEIEKEIQLSLLWQIKKKMENERQKKKKRYYVIWEYGG
jgi:hypothetical protein